MIVFLKSFFHIVEVFGCNINDILPFIPPEYEPNVTLND